MKLLKILYHKHQGRIPLQLRLSFWIVSTVLAVFTGATLLDFDRQRRQYRDMAVASLLEQARTLNLASTYIPEPLEFDAYVNAFCEQMNDTISPGHHILVLNGSGSVWIRARHHSGPEIEEAMLTADPNTSVLNLDTHRLAVARLKTVHLTIILARYLDPIEGMLRAQLNNRLWSGAGAALIVICLSSILIHLGVVNPIKRLVTTARQWAKRDFSVRAPETGPVETRLLAQEYNNMASQLQKHQFQHLAEMDQAKQIQANLLPRPHPTVSGLNLATAYKPADHVAGDIYDVFSLSENRTALAIIDVCGHGISAALLTGVVKMSLHRRLTETDSLSLAMKQVNADLLALTPEGRFVTACVGIWDAQDKSWTYCAAGHPGGFLVRKKRLYSLASTAPLLGVLDQMDWNTHHIQLLRSDRLFLYTDGLVEIDPADQPESYKPLETHLLQDPTSTIAAQVSLIMGNIAQDLHDDATLVAFEVL